MKKHILLISNIIIILSLMAGFVGVVYKETKTYQSLSEKYLENIVSLADTDISKQIENSMTKPVMVSKTMANDEFLKQWFLKEQENQDNDLFMQQLFSYLKTYKEKYGYTTVFCVSNQTGNYYYQDGLSKVISANNEHDIWYYNFIESGHEYELQIDTNEANHNRITAFVNFRMENDDGELLGVIGVGLEVSDIESILRSYEENYDLSMYIINVGGSENSFDNDTDVFVSEEELARRTKINEKILTDFSGEPNMQWFTSDNKRICLITKYDKTLGWYLILEKDINSISSSFQKGIMDNVIFMLISLAICIIVSTTVFLNFNRRMIEVENIDELTGLPNKKLFTMKYLSFVRKHMDRKKTFFMFDVDDFKKINDTYGHLFGNAILAMVGETLQNSMNGVGFAARWGGDEFVGMLEATPEEAESILNRFMDALKNGNKESCYHVTVSVGIAEIDEMLSMEQIIKKVDEAVYFSKQNGKNRITVCKNEGASNPKK
ncbi:MAG: sensor domain-containing diguanylate cyclase [Anaerotignum sp.]|nr:sensor domain-containing diguanylate cyclase [Anaerotignum sp.]